MITLLRRLLFRVRGWVFCSCGTFAIEARDRDKLWLSWDGTAHSVSACGPRGNFTNWPVAGQAVRL